MLTSHIPWGKMATESFRLANTFFDICYLSPAFSEEQLSVLLQKKVSVKYKMNDGKPIQFIGRESVINFLAEKLFQNPQSTTIHKCKFKKREESIGLELKGEQKEKVDSYIFHATFLFFFKNGSKSTHAKTKIKEIEINVRQNQIVYTHSLTPVNEQK